MDQLFVDTDVALDLLSRREPHYTAAAVLFSLADTKKIRLSISSLSFINLHYLLSRQYNAAESRRLLRKFKVLVKVLAVDDKIIDLALSSTFADFEDAIQYHAAIENGIYLLLTRNIRDYRKAQISVMTPESYLKLR
jgi:predicted nucleic acid-binding protein